MDIFFFIRGLIFLTAALIMLIYPDLIMKFQDVVFTKLKIKYRDSKKSFKILGYIFLAIAVALFVYSFIK